MKNGRDEHSQPRELAASGVGGVRERTWCGRTKMSALAPSTALDRSGSAIMFSPSVIPGRYFTFSCFSLMISVNLRPWNCVKRRHEEVVSLLKIIDCWRACEDAGAYLLFEAPHVHFGLEAVATLLHVLPNEVCDSRAPISAAYRG